MLNNNIFKLFFDYRGTLSRQEYWAGLIALFSLLCFNLFNRFTLNTCNSIFFNLLPIDENGFDWHLGHSINSVIENIFGVSLPISFITLYSSIVITLKRSRLLMKNNYSGVLGGILLYLLFETILAFIIFIIDSTSYSIGSISSTNTTVILFGRILFLFIGLLIILNLFILFKLSKKTKKDNMPINNNKYATVDTLFAIGKLMLGLFSCIFIVAIFFSISNNHEGLGYDPISDNIYNLISIVGAIIFIYILVKRASDAGLNPNKIYIPLLCYIFLYLVTLILPQMYSSLFFEFAFIYKALAITMNYANMASIIGIFILLGLPSKK